VMCTDGVESEAVRLTVHHGTAEITDGSGKPQLQLSRRTLGSMLAAGLRPMQAAELGLLRASPQALRLAEDMFAGPRFQCLDAF
jgi:predicted acetyltransferase